MRSKRLILAVSLLAVLSASTLSANPGDERRTEVGLRTILTTAGGEPANDQTGIGVYGEHRLKDGKWFVGGSIDRYGYDMERPWLAVNLVQDPTVKVIDAVAEAFVVNGWTGMEFGRAERRLHWFWLAGLGFSSPKVDDVTGPLEGSGMFDITTDPGTEILVSAAGGLKVRFAKRWTFRFAVRADHHFADWKVTDRVSSNTGTVDDYTGLGGNIALGIRF